jgi:hypothetical protein
MGREKESDVCCSGLCRCCTDLTPAYYIRRTFIRKKLPGGLMTDTIKLAVVGIFE